jgi:hypothetical protein
MGYTAAAVEGPYLRIEIQGPSAVVSDTLNMTDIVVSRPLLSYVSPYSENMYVCRMTLFHSGAG